MAASTYHFTLEAVGKVAEGDTAERWLREAAACLERAGFVMDDAQAVGLDGSRGCRVEFPDPVPKVLRAAPVDDVRSLSTEGRA